MQSSTFNEVTIGNKFFTKKECFVKMNKTQAIGNSGRLKSFKASQYVTIAIEKNRDGKVLERTGPGRPRLSNKKVSITIRIKPELLELITGNRSAFIEAAIVARLSR